MEYQKITNLLGTITARKMKFPIKDFFSPCDQVPSFPENFIFCAVNA